MTRVIHTGDTHIGYAQYHSPVRRQDFLDAFGAVIDDAVDSDVDAVIHAGDLFHDRRPELGDLMGTISVLRRLEDAEIPFLAVVGNHESTRGGQWLDLFERLGLATRLGDAPTVVADTAFYGLDHVPVSRRDDLEYAFEPGDAETAALVAHGLFEPFGYADWDTGKVLAESTVDFDAMLLGDNHTPDVAEVDGTWVTYPGSTERASASEREGRGYNLVAFGSDAPGDDRVDIRRRALDTRPFAFVEAELREGEGESRVRERVREHDLDGAVVLVDVTGEGDPVTPASIEAFATEEGALIARVNDRREVETDTEIDVSFADPEDAVRERIDGMTLSEVALDVEEAIRAETIPDSNVRETVKDRVEGQIADLGAFTKGSPPNAESRENDGTGAAESDDTGSGKTGADSDGATVGGSGGSDGDDGAGSDTENGAEDGIDNDAEDGIDDDSNVDGGAEETDRKTPGSDGQVSMEDYL